MGISPQNEPCNLYPGHSRKLRQTAAAALEMIAGASSQLLEYNVQLIVRCDEEARIPRAQQQGIEIGEQQTESQGIREGILHKTLSHWQSLRC